MPSMAEWVSSEVISAAVGLVFLLPAIIHYSTISFSCSFLPPKPPRNGKIVTQSHRHAAPRLMTNKWLTFYQMTISSCFDFTLQKNHSFVFCHTTRSKRFPLLSPRCRMNEIRLLQWARQRVTPSLHQWTEVAGTLDSIEVSGLARVCTRLCGICAVCLFCVSRSVKGSRYTRRLKDDVKKKESRVDRLDWRYSTIFVTLNKSHEKTTRNNEQACF